MNYGRYQVVSELGRGSMGVVYKAHDPQINRSIALKVLRKDRLTSKDYVQRFLKEATAIGRLSHYGIVTVFDVGQDHGTIYIAMELLRGHPLDQKSLSSKFQLQDIIKVGVHVNRALHYAHKMGIVHRDIKPPNIICTEEGTTKVTDFGIAHIDDPDGQQMTRAGEILGTPVYMAPEQILGQPVDGRTDLYSLGVILYELATGERPFQGENLAAVFRAITSDDPISPDQINPDIPPALSRSILKAMARNPSDRFASGHEFADALTSSLNTLTQPSSLPPVSEKPSYRLPLILIVIFLLIGGGLGGYYFFQPSDTQIVREKELENIPVYKQNDTSQIKEKSPLISTVSSSNKKPDTESEFAAGHPKVATLPPGDTKPGSGFQEIHAVVKINSHPEGAKLYLDGEYQGMTPVELNTAATKQEAKLQLQGHLEWKAQVDFSKGGEIPLSIRLIPE